MGQNCAFMHNCYSNCAYMHSYCSICISYFSTFFLSHPLFFSLSPLTLTSFVFSHLIPLASMIADRHQSLATDQHHTTVADQHHTTRHLINITADRFPLNLRFSHLIKIKPLPPINSLIKIKPLLHEA